MSAYETVHPFRGLYSPWRDGQEEGPVGYCPRCGGEVYAYSNVYGPWHICEKCFTKETQAYIDRLQELLDLSPLRFAEETGVEVERWDG